MRTKTPANIYFIVKTHALSAQGGGAENTYRTKVSIACIIKCVPTRDRGTAGPMVSAPRTSPRRLGVRLSSMQYFFRYHTGKCQAIGVRPSRPSLKSSLETQTENVKLPSQ